MLVDVSAESHTAVQPFTYACASMPPPTTVSAVLNNVILLSYCFVAARVDQARYLLQC